MLIEEDKFLLQNKKISNVFNPYFDSVADSFDLLTSFNYYDINNFYIIKNIMKWFRNHPSLIQIKQIVSNQAKCLFQSVSVHTVKEVIVASSSHKLIAGEIPIKVLKERGFTFEYLTCANKTFLSGKFPDSLNCQM